MRCSACDCKGDLLRRPELGDGGFYCLPCLREMFPQLESRTKKAKDAYMWRLKDQEREQLAAMDKRYRRMFKPQLSF